MPAGTWERVAPLYDLQLFLERRALRAVVEMIEERGGPGDAVLDVGTGTGAMLRALEGAPRPPSRVVGVDGSPAMLARVGTLPPRWRVERAGAGALPFAASKFSAATAGYLLHLLAPDDRAAALAEIHRVLVPGGLLGTITVAPWGGICAPLLSPSTRLAARSHGPMAGLRVLDPRPDLQAAGFELVVERTTRRGYPSLCLVSKRR